MDSQEGRPSKVCCLKRSARTCSTLSLLWTLKFWNSEQGLVVRVLARRYASLLRQAKFDVKRAAKVLMDNSIRIFQLLALKFRPSKHKCWDPFSCTSLLAKQGIYWQSQAEIAQASANVSSPSQDGSPLFTHPSQKQFYSRT